MAGSSGETTVCVTRLTTGTSMPAAASSFCSDCASRYPISPWLAAPQTSSVWLYTTSEARSERSSCAPTCGPLPWVIDQAISQTDEADHRLRRAAGIRQLLGNRSLLTGTDERVAANRDQRSFRHRFPSTLFALRFSLFAMRSSLSQG